MLAGCPRSEERALPCLFPSHSWTIHCLVASLPRCHAAWLPLSSLNPCLVASLPRGLAAWLPHCLDETPRQKGSALLKTEDHSPEDDRKTSASVWIGKVLRLIHRQRVRRRSLRHGPAAPLLNDLRQRCAIVHFGNFTHYTAHSQSKLNQHPWSVHFEAINTVRYYTYGSRLHSVSHVLDVLPAQFQSVIHTC